MQRQMEQASAPMMVPFYHRVADTNPNPWTISRTEFKRHVEYSLEHCERASLDEVQRRVHDGACSRPTITFTFDDGYAENCDYAIDLLVQNKMPCIYFVSLDHVLNQKPFQHDIDAGVPLRVNTISQIKDMAAAGIEIGLHTRTHPDFSKVTDESIIHDEIIVAKTELEQQLGSPIRYFAFPFGLQPQLTQPAIEAVHAAGLQGFCSAFGAYNVPGRDPFHIRRFHGDPEFSRFKNWLSFDPKKLRNEIQIRYRLPPSGSFDENQFTPPKPL